MGIKNERQQREREQWTEHNWTSVSHNSLNFSTSHLKLTHWGEKQKTILEQPTETCFLHPSLAEPSGWWSHITLDRQKTKWVEEWERGKGNPTRTGNAASNLSVIRDVRIRGWLHGGVRKREGKPIGLCLFISDTLLNQSWQASNWEGGFDWGDSWECLKNMTGLHSGTDRALFLGIKKCIS